MHINREDLAWAAGFFDGEGSTLLTKNHGKYYARLSVTQCHQEVLQKFQRIVNLGQIAGPHVMKQSQRKDMYYWYVCGFEQTQAVIAFLWEWLGTEKREQAKRVLALHGTRY